MRTYTVHRIYGDCFWSLPNAIQTFHHCEDFFSEDFIFDRSIEIVNANLLSFWTVLLDIYTEGFFFLGIGPFLRLRRFDSFHSLYVFLFDWADTEAPLSLGGPSWCWGSFPLGALCNHSFPHSGCVLPVFMHKNSKCYQNIQYCSFALKKWHNAARKRVDRQLYFALYRRFCTELYAAQQGTLLYYVVPMD